MGTGDEEAARRLLAASDRIEQWWAQDFKRSRVPANLTYTQFAILGLVSTCGGVSISQLADNLGLSNPTVVRAVDALERKNLAHRHRNESDGRMVSIAATPEGRRVRALLDAARRERLVHLLAGMSAEYVEGLVRGLEEMARATAEEMLRERVHIPA